MPLRAFKQPYGAQRIRGVLLPPLERAKSLGIHDFVRKLDPEYRMFLHHLDTNIPVRYRNLFFPRKLCSLFGLEELNHAKVSPHFSLGIVLLGSHYEKPLL